MSQLHSIPFAGQDLERPQIHSLLAQAVEKPLVLVVAGAGYGKTQAVYSFLQAKQAAVTWVQLSARDNLGSRFWNNFLHALAQSLPEAASSLRDIHFPETETQMDRALDILFNEQSPREKHIIVFDDAHLVSNEAVLRTMEALAHAFIPNTTIIVLARVMPPLHTVQLAAKGMVAFIDEAALRFSESETAQFLQEREIHMPRRSIANIHRSTEGWAFAVNLIALCLRQSGGREAYAISAMKRNIFKLIESEVFSAVSPELQHWLVKFSLIEHLSLDFIGRMGFGEAHTRELGRVGSFIRYDSFLNAYHIHHLFLEYLLQKQDLLGENERRELYLQAAEWCLENDYRMDAISYYEKAGSYPQIIAVVDTLSLVVPVDIAMFVLQIFDRAPAGTFDNLVKYNTMRTRLLISTGRLEEVYAEIDGLIQKYAPLPPLPFNNRVLCGAYNCLGVTDLLYSEKEDQYDFPAYFERADAYYSMTPFHTGMKTSMDLGAYACMVKSPRQDVMREYLDSVARAAPHVSNSYNGYMRGLDDLARGELAYFQSDMQAARRFISQAAGRAREREQYDIANRAMLYLLRIAAAEGNYESAQRALAGLEAQLEWRDYHFRDITYDIATSWYYLTIGQPGLVAHWLKVDIEGGSLNRPLTEFSNSMKAKVYYSGKRYDDFLAISGSGPFIMRFLLGRLEMKVLEACSLFRVSEKEAAVAALEEAYRLAQPNRLDMPFLERGNDMRALAAFATQQHTCAIPREWLERISTRASTYHKRISFISSRYKKENKLDDAMMLTAREMDVLTDLYHGLSRQEIADSRYISINTVKSVLNMIFSKLGAANRVDAVRIALDRELIQA